MIETLLDIVSMAPRYDRNPKQEQEILQVSMNNGKYKLN